jgi:hypothetical protein
MVARLLFTTRTKEHHSSFALDLQDYRVVEFDALQRCAEVIQVDDGCSVQGVDSPKANTGFSRG